MQRLADTAHLSLRHRAMMCGVKFRAHHTLSVAGHHKSGHRSQRFRQRRRRAAMQQAKRLMSTGINRISASSTSSPRRVYTIPRCATIVLSLVAFSSSSVKMAFPDHAYAPSVEPPSTTISCRVIWLARSEARNKIVLAISCGRAIFPSGMPSLNCSPKPRIRCSSASSLTHSVRCISVSVEPGETTLQRTPLPASSSPTLNARLFSAAFDAP